MNLQKINWKLILVTVTVAALSLSLLAKIFYDFFLLVKSENPVWQDTSIKTQNILTPEVHLYNKDDCASVIVTSICRNNICEHHVNAFQTLCSEVLSAKDSEN